MFTNRRTIIILFSFNLFLLGCGQESEPYSKEAARENYTAQNKNIEQWSNVLLKDLQKRHRLVNSISDSYEGNFILDEKQYSARFVFSSNFPEFVPDRERRIDELVHEINSLGVNAHVLLWPEGAPNLAISCVFENTKPDYVSGQVDFVAKSCPSSFYIAFRNVTAENLSPEEVSIQAMNSDEFKVDALTVQFQSSTFAIPINFKVELAGE